MNGVTHMAVGGMAGGLLLVYSLSTYPEPVSLSGYELYPVVAAFAGIAGGLAPDVDMPRSKAGRFVRNAIKFIVAFCAVHMLIIYISPETGVTSLDSAIALFTGVNRAIPPLTILFCIGLFAVIEKVKHRGFTHTPVALLIVSAPLLYMLLTRPVFAGANIAISAQIGFLMGYLSHMVIDTFNYPGTPWLWPMTTNHFNIMRIDSGTHEETAFLIASIIVFAVGYAVILFVQLDLFSLAKSF